jgi:L-arabinose isomerase
MKLPSPKENNTRFVFLEKYSKLFERGHEFALFAHTLLVDISLRKRRKGNK